MNDFKSRRAVVITPSISQPRYHKRIRALEQSGFNVTVYTFRRGYYENNSMPGQVFDLGSLENLAYIRRIPRLIRAFRFIKEKESGTFSPSIVWAFGLDCMLLATAAFRNSKFIYEVGDIQEILFKRTPLGWIARYLDKKCVAKSSALVLTSPMFYQGFYKAEYDTPEEHVYFLENKLTDKIKSYPRITSVGTDKIKIGVIGNLRFERTLIPFMEYASGLVNDKFEVHVYGDGALSNQINHFASKSDHIFFHGAFNNPVDLPVIYSKIDVVFCVYDVHHPNVRFALPNKLYEACYFGKPIIVAADTALDIRVRKWRCGFSINVEDPAWPEEVFKKLAQFDFSEFESSSVTIPENSILESSDDYKELINA